MSAESITFVLFLSGVGLVAWQPRGAVLRSVRGLGLLLFGALTGLALAGSLFTVWWPPTLTWAVIWSVASFLLLLVAAIRGSFGDKSG